MSAPPPSNSISPNIIEEIIIRIPTSVDRTSQMTPIKNQGQCGSCWTFCAVGLIESGRKVKNGSTFDLAEQEIVDCCTKSLISNICSMGSGCNGGNSEQALTYVSKSGIAL
jgi:C1A family cysteine protease